MKGYTPALVNTGKAKTSVKTLIFGNAKASSYYYSARHKTEDIFILFIETSRFGNTFCFPCVLEEQGDPMVYLTGRGVAQKSKNTALIQRWGLFVKPSSFNDEFIATELTPQDFHKEYSEYKARASDEPSAETEEVKLLDAGSEPENPPQDPTADAEDPVMGENDFARNDSEPESQG